MKKYKIIALIGKSGAGKDYLLHRMCLDNPSYEPIVSCTTRPKREGETEGIDYHYLTETEFLQQQYDGQFLETSEFRKWHYGTRLKDLSTSHVNIGVFNPQGIYSLLKLQHLVDLEVIYVYAPDKVRLLRQLNREEEPDCAEICRRFMTDEEDFRALDFVYTFYDNSI